MQDKIDLLDHGFVRLVDSMGGDISISRAARVSYDAAWRAGADEGSDAKLIRSLWQRRHTTPFEVVEFQFEVMAPIFTFRQWHRHRTQTINELSARYRELPKLYYLPAPESIGAQSKASKQGRVFVPLSDEALGQRLAEIEDVRTHCEAAFDLYHKLLAALWPRELARMVLPLNVYSHMFAKVDLLNLLRFLDLRDDEHAQYEIRVYAEAMATLAASVAPVAMAAWREGRAAVEAKP